MTTTIRPPGENTLRILVATDNHLGFLGTDPIRGEDSFETMDEILQIGRDHHCDCAFLSGDLFHHNKPSRRTMFRTQQIFKKHVFGDGPVSIQVTSDQKSNFGGRIVNYEDPNLSVQLPIFIIHGNHDDPTREGATEALSAIDILAEAGLVNYFGRADKADDIRIRPVLIEKGMSRVALYGLGWIRDERLHRAFNEKKVTFIKVDDENGNGSKNWFNIMLIHQNREQKGRGEKNCVAESMIPEFMDFVIFGHEHECEIEPIAKGPMYLCQPGSSVAISLVEGEAIPKHVGILDVKWVNNIPSFKMNPIPLKTVRTFLLENFVELSGEESLKVDMPETEKQDAVMQFLTTKVRTMLEEHSNKLKIEKEKSNKSEEDEDNEEMKRKSIPIIRIKVEHTGFPTINLQRFGAQFTTTVANPGEILSFWKKKRQSARIRKDGGMDDLPNEDDILNGEEEIALVSPQDRIQKIIEQVLQDSAQKLELLTDQKLHLAVEEFAVKDSTTAIHDYVEERIENIQNTLRKERNQAYAANNNGGMKIFNENAALEEINLIVEKQKKKEELERKKLEPQLERQELLRQSELKVGAKKISLSSQEKKKKRKSNHDENESDEEEDSDNAKVISKATKGKQSKSPNRAVANSKKIPSKKTKIISSGEENEEEDQKRKMSKSTTTTNNRPPAVPKSVTTISKVATTTTNKKRKAEDDSEEDDNDNDYKNNNASELLSQAKYSSSSMKNDMKATKKYRS